MAHKNRQGSFADLQQNNCSVQVNTGANLCCMYNLGIRIHKLGMYELLNVATEQNNVPSAFVLRRYSLRIEMHV